MKKIYLAAMAVAALTVSSCSQDEVLNMNPEAGAKAIEFGVYTGKAPQARAAETTENSIKGTGIHAGFGVTAVYTGQSTWSAATAKKANFMFNQQVKWTDLDGEGSGTEFDWTYNPLKYWPTQMNDKVSFFAYAPYSPTVMKVDETDASGNITFTNTDTNASKITYTHADDLSENVDFVAASAIDQKESDFTTSNTLKKNIQFTMKHELTRLALKAKVSEEVYIKDDEHRQTKIVIYDVKLQNKKDFTGAHLYSEAEYSFNTDVDATNPVGEWSGEATKAKTVFDLNSVIAYEDDLTVGQKNYTKTSGTASAYPNGALALTGMTEVSLLDTESNDYLYMIPALTSTAGITGFDSGNLNLLVTYDIVTIDAKLSPNYSCTKATKIIPVSLSGDSGKFLEQGKSYTLTLTFKVNEVKLNGTVDGWVNGFNNGEEVNRDKEDKK